jgi:hypothetical protein
MLDRLSLHQKFRKEEIGYLKLMIVLRKRRF